MSNEQCKMKNERRGFLSLGWFQLLSISSAIDDQQN